MRRVGQTVVIARGHRKRSCAPATNLVKLRKHACHGLLFAFRPLKSSYFLKSDRAL